MKKDTEVKRFMQERHKGATQRFAAARAGISERTARTYERAGKLYVIYNLERSRRLLNNLHYVYSELVSDVLFQRSRARLYIIPSQLKCPHTWRTRPNPFEEDWPWVVEQLERDEALQATTLFALLCERHPERYQPVQVRTLQRHIAQWKALHGKIHEVIFEQQHRPGERSQSDFTHMTDLGITLGGVPCSTSAVPFRADLLKRRSGDDLL